jgi:prolyl oligopeptidase PreP (S9A serine peptidase family)
MIRTYMMYAGLTFLGYEYGETEEAVVFRTIGKFGPPQNWNETEYKATLIEWREMEPA